MGQQKPTTPDRRRQHAHSDSRSTVTSDSDWSPSRNSAGSQSTNASDTYQKMDDLICSQNNDPGDNTEGVLNDTQNIESAQSIAMEYPIDPKHLKSEDGVEFVATDLGHWHDMAMATVSDFQGKPEFLARTFRIECDYATFGDEILTRHVPSARFEYVDGSAEVTVFASSTIHNSIGLISYNNWLWQLPDLPYLHSSSLHNGLNRLVHITADSLVRYKDDPEDSKKKDYAPDAQFSSQLHTRTMDKGGIIIEVAYSESLKHAKDKAVEYLWSDEPRPSVVVIFIFKKETYDKDYLTTTVNFEVHRRDEENEGGTETYETGYAYPEEKLNEINNPQTIEFSLQEIVGNIDVLNRFVELEKTPELIENVETRRIILELEDGHLAKIRDAVELGISVSFPLSLVAEAINDALPAQKATKDSKEGVDFDLMKHSMKDIKKSLSTPNGLEALERLGKGR